MENNGNGNHIARDAALSHFALMFGYKIFSLYYPLFLAAQGLSLAQIGKVYFLIYIPMAIAAPLAGFLTKLVHPALLAAVACLGYSAYALAMVFDAANAVAIYGWQIALGISAAIFATAVRALMIRVSNGNAENDFSWFYNATYWAAAAAPAAGAIIIWQLSFEAAFMIAAAICGFAAVLSLGMITYQWQSGRGLAALPRFAKSFAGTARLAFSKKVSGYVALAFAVLLAESALHPFFVLFLKDELALGQSQAMMFLAGIAAAFSIFYFFVLRRWQTGNPKIGIIRGGAAAGVSTLAFGLFLPFLCAIGAFLMELIRNAGGFLSGTGRSALLAEELKSRPSEAAAIDTVFSPLAVGLAAILGGYILNSLGYQALFLISGVMILAVAGLVLIAKKRGME